MIHVILVEPIYEGNVGAVARIMNNFGFTSLRIVGSVPKKNDFYLAMHSEHILEEAQVFDSLKDASADLDRLIAFSRRVGRYKPVDLNPPQMADYCAKIPKLEIGLVFGRETFGLTDEEADLCPLRCHIPANPAFPSINLAQAVTIALWQIHSLPLQGAKPRQLRAVDGNELDRIRNYMLDVMRDCGFFRSHETTNWELFLDKMLAQLNPGKMMVWRLRQMFNRWHVLVTGKGKGYGQDQ
ncbi:MAG: RNA methyltransferase [Candidatus Cloacimonadota bacterium]|jgi:TrmH family RNA methyltransferase|nr:RNA methyltransferase [Candidatus Cloacimonadota bacterium]OQC09418.1 MAG: putative tRNA/rRNA methyltransferase [Candidatus Cloacimonetes bacterium ADurb.Bin088]